jgi:hypothetical protein
MMPNTYQTMSLFGDAPVARPAPARSNGKVEIFFDGGCLGNPGQKYGSFQVLLDGRPIASRSRVGFGHGTNNEAEFNSKKIGSSTFIMGNDCRIRFSTRHFWSRSIVLWRKSARGLAHSKTLRAVRVRSVHAPASWSAAALRRFGTSTRVISLRTRPQPPQASIRILQCCRLPRCSGMNVQSRLYPLKMSRSQKIHANIAGGPCQMRRNESKRSRDACSVAASFSCWACANLISCGRTWSFTCASFCKR